MFLLFCAVEVRCRTKWMVPAIAGCVFQVPFQVRYRRLKWSSSTSRVDELTVLRGRYRAPHYRMGPLCRVPLCLYLKRHVRMRALTRSRRNCTIVDDAEGDAYVA